MSEENKEEEEIKNEDVDDEIEKLKKRVLEIDEETKKINEMQSFVEKDLNSEVQKEDLDIRSVYIGNVDYQTTPEELQNHFKGCGTINRVFFKKFN
jgi:polyadenylate-binding protein 2